MQQGVQAAEVQEPQQAQAGQQEDQLPAQVWATGLVVSPVIGGALWTALPALRREWFIQSAWMLLQCCLSRPEWNVASPPGGKPLVARPGTFCRSYGMV